ncbi:MAG: metabolite traffic protein EboE [Pseudomonadota bacterium]
MDLGGNMGHLTYCLNIHHTETWDEARAALEGPVKAVKKAVCPDAPFAVGLRFSARALADLIDPAERALLKSICTENDFVPLTMNGFPYGPFHGVRVKEQVYQPDWRMDERVAYTTGLADLMAELVEPGAFLTLSTVPGTFKPMATGAETAMADRYLQAASHCAKLREETGVTVALAIEPEPFCFLETIGEVVAFFDEHLYSAAAEARFAELSGVAKGEAGAALRRHLGLCYDVCHAAVEYEDPAGSIAMLRDAGIPVHKLQLSAALQAMVDADVRAALAAYSEPTYLHQVLSRKGGGPVQGFQDLPEALARGAVADGEEWRIHFHVPVFLSDLGPFQSTQGFLTEILAIHKRQPIAPHLEVETYTWDVLPEALRTQRVEKAVARELRWVLETLDR